MSKCKVYRQTWINIPGSIGILAPFHTIGMEASEVEEQPVEELDWMGTYHEEFLQIGIICLYGGNMTCLRVLATG